MVHGPLSAAARDKAGSDGLDVARASRRLANPPLPYSWDARPGDARQIASMQQRTIWISWVIVGVLGALGCEEESGPPEVARITNGSVAYDADNDGYADVGLYQRATRQYHVYFGGPDGLSAERFASADASLEFGDATYVGDVDGDGNADAVLTQATLGSSPNFRLVFGSAARDLETVSLSCRDGNAPETEAGVRVRYVGDITGDGIDDLFATAAGGRLCVFRGGPRDSFSEPTFFLQQGAGSVPALVRGLGDVDGDDIMDVALGNQLLPGGSDPLATTRGTISAFPASVSDFNGDGLMDYREGNGFNFNLFFGTQSGYSEPVRHVCYTAETTNQAGASRWTELGDIDGDGRAELAYSFEYREPTDPDADNGLDGYVAIFYGSEQGLTGRVDTDLSRPFLAPHGFTPRAPSGLTGFRPGWAQGIGDINGDGYGDVGVEVQGAGIAWYFGSAGGVRGGAPDGHVVVNAASPNMATTGAGSLERR